MPATSPRKEFDPFVLFIDLQVPTKRVYVSVLSVCVRVCVHALGEGGTRSALPGNLSYRPSAVARAGSLPTDCRTTSLVKRVPECPSLPELFRGPFTKPACLRKARPFVDSLNLV